MSSRVLAALRGRPSALTVVASPRMSTSEFAEIAFPSAKAVRFPAECAQCGSPPSNGYLLVGERLEARVPLCPACDGRKTQGMGLWVVGTTLGSILSAGLLGALAELVLPFPQERGLRAVMGMVGALVMIAFGGGLLVLVLRRRAALYHRLLSPVFVLGHRDGVTLGFRNARFAEATRALVAGAQDASDKPTAAFVAPRLPGYGLPAGMVALGLGMFAAAVMRYLQLSSARGTVLLRSLEIAAHAIAGAAGVLALYGAVALAVVAFGGAWLREVRRTRASVLRSTGGAAPRAPPTLVQ